MWHRGPILRRKKPQRRAEELVERVSLRPSANSAVKIFKGNVEPRSFDSRPPAFRLPLLSEKVLPDKPAVAFSEDRDAEADSQGVEANAGRRESDAGGVTATERELGNAVRLRHRKAEQAALATARHRHQ